MFHSYLGTLLYYSFFFFSFDYHTFLSIPPLLYISMHPCIVVSPRILVSLYRLDSSFFSFCPPPPCPLYSTVPACFIFLYLPSLFFDIPATGPTIFVGLSFLYGLPGHPCTYLLPSSLLKSLVLPMRTRIYSTLFIRSPPNPRHIYLA